MIVEDLMRAGLSVRTISIGTGIPVGSVHRAMRAVVRAEAKREIAVAEIAEKLGTKLRRKARGSRNCFQRAATIASILLTRQSPWSHIRQSSVGDFLNLAARMKF